MPRDDRVSQRQGNLLAGNRLLAVQWAPCAWLQQAAGAPRGRRTCQAALAHPPKAPPPVVPAARDAATARYAMHCRCEPGERGAAGARQRGGAPLARAAGRVLRALQQLSQQLVCGGRVRPWRGAV